MDEKCGCENGGKREAQFIESLFMKFIETHSAPPAPVPPPDNELRQVIFGPEGEIDKGLLGKMHKMDLVLVDLKSGQKSMGNWLKVGVTVNLFLLSILTAHLADSPKSALADVPEPPAITQEAPEPMEGPMYGT